MKGKFSIQDPEDMPDLEDIRPFNDVSYTITILIGRSRMTLARLLQLSQGDVVELTKSAGESLEVFANDKLIAKGDVTVIEDRFAVSVTEIVNPDEQNDDSG